MPTGYTAELVENDQSFAFFVLGCAKAFGACIEQRDTPITELPTAPVKSTYYEDALRDAEIELKMLQAMSNQEIIDYGVTHKEANIAYNEEQINKKTIVRGRILNMISKVTEWTPPTPDHVGLKTFMLEQLQSTLDHDGDLTYYTNALAEECNKPIEEYHSDAVWCTEQSIERYKKEVEKESTRTDGRSKWISELFNSLSDDPALAWTLLQK